ncbi:MAG: regulatory protein LuxR, partial [Acidimicrobiales bacterium]|nr:regulatory protein LuxR [Acidimicrobiales bacterium]
RVRMAVHTGEADLRDEHNYGGEAIIRAARMRSLAHGGQVLVSSVTADVVADRLPAGAELTDLGVHRLKAMGRPQRVHQLHHPELASTFPPLRSLDMAKATVPVVLTSFVGRTKELAEGRALLADTATRLVTLVGPGGCGKTRLAATLAGEQGDELDGGVWWVDLAPLTDAVTVANAVMAVLGIGDTGGRTPLERLAQYLAGRRALLVLDNCEHVLAGTRDLAAVLLHACPELTVMATSREPLGLAGETVWPVPTLGHNDAVRLFVDRATKARPNFTLDEARATTVEAICARLDGIPLAVELAAARTRMLTPQRILAGIDDRFHLLTGGSPADAPRQQSLRASVEWSHDLLSTSEQAVLRRLSVFAGGFTLDAAEQVAPGGAVDAFEVLDLLGRLVDRSLVAVDDDRYHLLETIRAFAAARLADAGEEDDVRSRHLASLIDLAETAGAAIERTSDLDWLTRLEDEHDNMRAALTWAFDGGDPDGGAALAVALIPFWSAHGHYWDALLWLSKAVEVDGAAVRTRARWGLGHLRLLGMQVESGYGYLDAEQALALARESGEVGEAARALTDLAFIETVLAGGQTTDRFVEALTSARQAGDVWAEGYLLLAHAFIKALFTDRHEDVGPLVDQIRALARTLGNSFMLATADGLEAMGHERRGEMADARPGLERQYAAAREHGDPFIETYAAMGLAALELSEGRMDAARRLLGDSRVRLSHSARGRMEGVDLMLAAVCLAEGDADGVVVMCNEWGPAIDELGVAYLSGLRLMLLGRAMVETGDLDRARSTIDFAFIAAELAGNPWLQASALQQKAVRLRAADEPGPAEDVAHEALALALEHTFRPDVARAVEILAGLAIAGESWAEGVRLAAAAAAWRERSGCRAWPIDQRRLGADLDLARTALGDDEWAAAWAEGEALVLDDAVAYATRARGERRRPSSGWASLTPTETDVVRLVAEGLTNPDIAARLFVSRATVKT